MKNESDLVKVVFELSNDWHGAGSESLWAEPTEKGTVVLRNTPFFFMGVSFLDEVQVTVNNNQELVYDKVLKKSGHSTIRILQPQKKNIDLFNNYWKPLELLGCGYESKIDNNALYAVDIPPGLDINKVRELLDRGLKDDIWDYEEADIVN